MKEKKSRLLLLLKGWVGQVAELKAEEAASRLEDPEGFLYDPINVRAVADAKRDGVGVH